MFFQGGAKHHLLETLKVHHLFPKISNTLRHFDTEKMKFIETLGDLYNDVHDIVCSMKQNTNITVSDEVHSHIRKNNSNMNRACNRHHSKFVYSVVHYLQLVLSDLEREVIGVGTL